MGPTAFAPEQQTAKLILEFLYRAAQGWLGEVAPFRGAGEVQGFADGEKIAHLMHFHDLETYLPLVTRGYEDEILSSNLIANTNGAKF